MIKTTIADQVRTILSARPNMTISEIAEVVLEQSSHPEMQSLAVVMETVRNALLKLQKAGLADSKPPIGRGSARRPKLWRLT